MCHNLEGVRHKRSREYGSIYVKCSEQVKPSPVALKGRGEGGVGRSCLGACGFISGSVEMVGD